MSRDITPFALRMPPDLRKRIEEAAKANGRSINSELVHRLERTFEQEEQGQRSVFISTGSLGEEEVEKAKAILRRLIREELQEEAPGKEREEGKTKKPADDKVSRRKARSGTNHG